MSAKPDPYPTASLLIIFPPSSFSIPAYAEKRGFGKKYDSVFIPK
jgi:hypothetical protein